MATKNNQGARLTKAALTLTAAAGMLALATPVLGQSTVTTPVELVAPETSVLINLGPYDPPVTVSGSIKGMWRCNIASDNGLETRRKSADLYWKIWNDRDGNGKNFAREAFLIMVNTILNAPTDDPIRFWNSQPGFEFPLFKPVLLNPNQGQLMTKTVKNCYTEDELSAAQREAVRWAKYMKTVWLPANKVGK